MSGRNVPDQNPVVFGPASGLTPRDLSRLKEEVERDISAAQVQTESKVAEIASQVTVAGGGDMITNITQVEGSISERADIDTYDVSTNTGTATAVTSGSITYTNGTGTVLYPGDEVVVLLLTDQTWLVLSVISRASPNPLPTPGNPTYPYTPVTGFPQNLATDPFAPYPQTGVITTGGGFGVIPCGVDSADNLGFGADTILTTRGIAPRDIIAAISAGAGTITFLAAPVVPDRGVFVWQDELWIVSTLGVYHRWKPGSGWYSTTGPGNNTRSPVLGPQTIGGNTYLFYITTSTTGSTTARVQLGVASPTSTTLTLTRGGTGVDRPPIIGNGYIWVLQSGNWYRQALTTATSYTTGWSVAVPAPAGNPFGVDTAGNLLLLNRQGSPVTWSIRALSVTGIVYEVPQVFSLNGVPSEGEPVSYATGTPQGALSIDASNYNVTAYQAGANLWVIPYLVSMKYLEPGRTNPTTDTVAAAQNYVVAAVGTMSTALGYHKWSAPVSAFPDAVRTNLPGNLIAVGTDGYKAAAVQILVQNVAPTFTVNWCTMYPL